MAEQLHRDRPAKNPGGVECQRCNNIFIGEEWHNFCGICIKEVADELATEQGLRAPVGHVQVTGGGNE